MSKIENDLVSPTFANLMRLAEGLQISLRELVTLKEDEGSVPARMTVTRRKDIRFRSTPEYDMYALCAELRHKRMTPLIERVKADVPSRFDGMVSYSGEEFFVLNGAIEVHTEHCNPMRLEKGDSAYLDGTMAHTLAAMDCQDADTLMVWLGPHAVDQGDGTTMAEAILNQDC